MASSAAPAPACARRWTGPLALLASTLLGGALGAWWGADAMTEPRLRLAAMVGVVLGGGLLAWCLGSLCHGMYHKAARLREELAQSRATEQGLQQRERFYRTVLEDIPEMICRWYPDGRISYVNEAYCRYFQVSREELLRGGVPLFHPGANRFDAPFYRAKPVVVMEFPVPQADGSVRWQRWVDRALFDEYGAIREFQSIGEDVTAGKRAEEEAARLLEENRRLARMALAIQEEERANLARELHDELGQALTAIRAEAECIRQLNRQRSPTIDECAGAINTVAGQVYGVVRDMMHRLRPALLDDFGLGEALQELMRQWRSHHPDITLKADVEPLPALPPAVELAVYRIVQEALNNIAKHAAASRVELRLCMRGERLELQVRDDGRGIAKRATASGYGLVGMRERTLAVGGEFHVTTGPGMGTTVQAALPLTQAGGMDGG